jgi:hypothetical protein
MAKKAGPKDIAGPLRAKGYFPKELPPCFTTAGYSEHLEKKRTVLPDPLKSAKKWSRPTPYQLVRTSAVRRTLSIVSPINFAVQSQRLADAWPEFQKVWASSPISVSAPILNSRTGRSLVPTTRRHRVVDKRVEIRAGRRFVVRADVTRFYQSIYTHSIPWALHGKGTAKKKIRDKGLLGNMLDEVLRGGQDGQTIGIPTGPDTSFMIAELILSAVDSRLAELTSGLSGLRFFDDYEFGCDDSGLAGTVLDSLSRALRDYELELNPAKTQIAALPEPLSERLPEDIGHFTLSTSPGAQRSELLVLFDRSVQHAARHPDSSVYLLAMRKLRRATFSAESWTLWQQMMLQLCANHPGLLREAVRQLAEQERRGFDLDRVALKRTLSSMIRNHLPLGNTSEVCWALWAHRVFAMKLDPQHAAAVVDSADPIASLLVLDLLDAGHVTKAPEVKGLVQRLTAADLYTENWLLAYEAYRQGWLKPAPSMKSFVENDDGFGFLYEGDVAFYDNTAVEDPFRQSASDEDEDDTQRAFHSDHGSDEAEGAADTEIDDEGDEDDEEFDDELEGFSEGEDW